VSAATPVKADCCKEPVAGPVADNRMLRQAWTALGPLVRGAWPSPYSLLPGEDRAATLSVLDDILAGLYLVVDVQGRLRWLGHPERARVYAGVLVVEADPFSPRTAIEAAEGCAADLIGLRGRMGPRTWPVVSHKQWLTAVTSRDTARRASMKGPGPG
jgi:hypothetical protein